MSQLLARSFYYLRKLYYWIVRPVTVGVKAVVFDHEGRVLLVKHSYMAGWHFPGGGLHRGETIAEAAHRELREETGLQGEAGSERLLGVYSNFLESKSDHVVVFVIEKWTGELRRSTSDGEIIDAQFFARDRFPEGITAATVRRLDEWAALRSGTPLASNCRW